MDTTLNVEWERVESVLPWVNRFLVDVKFMKEENHIRYTKRSGVKTRENLLRLSQGGYPVLLRMPLIEGLNNTEEEIAARVELLDRLHNVERIDCFAVLGHGAGKYRALQRTVENFNGGVDPERLTEGVKKRLETLKARNEKMEDAVRSEKGAGI